MLLDYVMLRSVLSPALADVIMPDGSGLRYAPYDAYGAYCCRHIRCASFTLRCYELSLEAPDTAVLPLREVQPLRRLRLRCFSSRAFSRVFHSMIYFALLRFHDAFATFFTPCRFDAPMPLPSRYAAATMPISLLPPAFARLMSFRDAHYSRCLRYAADTCQLRHYTPCRFAIKRAVFSRFLILCHILLPFFLLRACFFCRY